MSDADIGLWGGAGRLPQIYVTRRGSGSGSGSGSGQWGPGSVAAHDGSGSGSGQWGPGSEAAHDVSGSGSGQWGPGSVAAHDGSGSGSGQWGPGSVAAHDGVMPAGSAMGYRVIPGGSMGHNSAGRVDTWPASAWVHQSAQQQQLHLGALQRQQQAPLGAQQQQLHLQATQPTSYGVGISSGGRLGNTSVLDLAPSSMHVSPRAPPPPPHPFQYCSGGIFSPASTPLLPPVSHGIFSAVRHAGKDPWQPGLVGVGMSVGMVGAGPGRLPGQLPGPCSSGVSGESCKSFGPVPHPLVSVGVRAPLGSPQGRGKEREGAQWGWGWEPGMMPAVGREGEARGGAAAGSGVRMGVGMVGGGSWVAGQPGAGARVCGPARD